MTISPEMVEYIRTMVKGDHAANDRIEAKLDAQGWDDFPTLLGAVFYFAVNRRFGASTTAADVMVFVAEMRAAAPAGSPEIDANAAESLVRAALDPSLDLDIDPQMAGRIQGLAILHILSSPHTTDEDLDDLLANAVEAARRA
ncbi:hypothetical protein ABNF97_01725 [Plantactinospora sp. B6F1]|uniref:hypothetical protein n=1 Tax=Plantactinospora sp. B6F1 TaxID=3158971 RepID=UPI0032D91E22